MSEQAQTQASGNQPGDGLARSAYDAYGRAVGYKNFQGKPMPEWDQLGEKVKAGWRAASHSVAHEVAKMLSDPKTYQKVLNDEGTPAPQITRVQQF